MRALYYREVIVTVGGKEIVVVTEPIGRDEITTTLASVLDRRWSLVTKIAISGVRISSIFLAIDHNYGGVGYPILYETMIFGGSLEGHQERHTTRAAAKRAHRRLILRCVLRIPLDAAIRLAKWAKRRFR